MNLVLWHFGTFLKFSRFLKRKLIKIFGSVMWQQKSTIISCDCLCLSPETISSSCDGAYDERKKIHEEEEGKI